ncbi:nucleoside phosphorylase [Desertivirga brevis]|uniref:nucleoside phosphorylase n=1 Tax=Desertivirga brevis TaxID=2810310 RepID=UPI001A96510A|nr:nucleoside phosphorylase [Pedobacter sp. SYSU D00873]
MIQYSDADLILNPDGSVYHLNLLPEDIADTIITVGDPDRVSEVSAFFDKLELKKGKREFITHTGYIGKKRLSVVSTGIGTDNIDIVINELDALVNIDLKTRKEKAKKKSLEIIRIGTSGTLQDDIPVDTILVSEFAIGLDSLMPYYSRDYTPQEKRLEDAIERHLNDIKGISPYAVEPDLGLLTNVGDGAAKGITITAPGFYAPQGRALRAKQAIPFLLERLQKFSFDDKKITNFEMETAGIYALAKVLGHKALSVNAILANRKKGSFSAKPQKVIMASITFALKNIIKL